MERHVKQKRWPIHKQHSCQMSKNPKITSKPVASEASKVLRSASTSATAKSLAGSALSQRVPSHQTSGKVEELAGGVLDSAKYSPTTRSLAGSVLSQSNKQR